MRWSLVPANVCSSNRFPCESDKGPVWFNQALTSHPNALEVTIREVLDGDHSDLLANDLDTR